MFFFQIELLVSCTELAKVDTFSKTDPMCALFIKRFGQWKEYGRSEAVMDMVNPKVSPKLSIYSGKDCVCTKFIMFCSRNEPWFVNSVCIVIFV